MESMIMVSERELNGELEKEVSMAPTFNLPPPATKFPTTKRAPKLEGSFFFFFFPFPYWEVLSFSFLLTFQSVRSIKCCSSMSRIERKSGQRPDFIFYLSLLFIFL